MTDTRLRDLVPAVLLWLGFCASLIFYGVGFNLIVLLLASLPPLIVLTLQGPAPGIAAVRRLDPRVLTALWIVVAIVVSYQAVTISADSSFAASWMLACIPLWYLAYRTLPARRLLRNALFATVALLGVISTVDYLATGTRAYEPLRDPNNFATLLYLAWIPFAHDLLLRTWRDGSTTARLWPGYLLSLALTLAIFATFSRVGLVLVAAALGGWLILALRQRLSLRPWLLLTGTVVLAYGGYLLQVPESVATPVDVARFVSVADVRGALNGAAWEMFLEAPLTGLGLFTFPLLYPLYRHLDDQSTSGMFAHNDYLQLAAETGIWLLVPLAVLAFATIRLLLSGLARRVEPGLLASFGAAMALAAVLAHALVNFVFYILPLGIGVAVLCAEAFDTGVDRHADGLLPDAASTSAGPSTGAWQLPKGAALGWLAAVLFGWSSWLYLGLDTVTGGVFGGQPTIGYLRDLGRDEARMLDYARLARKLNPERGTPVLAEALVLTAALRRDPGSDYLKEQVLIAYRDAVAIDPLNASIYEQLYGFLAEFMDPKLRAKLTEEETAEALLLQTVSLDVRRVSALLTLVSLYDRRGREAEALALLEKRALPWLEWIKRSSPEAAARLVSEMRQRARASGNSALLEQLENRQLEVADVAPEGKALWFERWQERFAL